MKEIEMLSALRPAASRRSCSRCLRLHSLLLLALLLTSAAVFAQGPSYPLPAAAASMGMARTSKSPQVSSAVLLHTAATSGAKTGVIGKFRTSGKSHAGTKSHANAKSAATASASYSGTAYNGPHVLPGTVQCEDYDQGGEGVGYQDTDAGNNGGAYRSDDVDIENCSDTGGGYDVGWTAAGEWLRYSVQVQSAGTYTVSFRVASPSGGGTFHLEDETGANLTGSVTAPATGNWEVFTTVTASAALTAGSHVLRLVEETGGYNLNWMAFAAAPSVSITQVLAINAGGGAASPFVADTDVSGGNTYATTSGIDTSSVTNPAPQAVYQTERWGNFTYTLPGLTPGTSYTLRLHFAEISGLGAGQRQFNVLVNGTQVLTNFDIFAVAGGPNKAIVESFPATANSSGQIVVQFANGAADNAKVDGLEVLSAGTGSSGTSSGEVHFYPRSGLASRLVGGKFQGSNDGTTYTDLYTIASQPTDGQWTTATLTTDPKSYRYLRYLAPNGAYGNIAELAFYTGTGAGATKLTGIPFGTPGSWNNDGNDFTKVFDGDTTTFFDAPDPGNGDYVGIDQGTGGTPTGAASIAVSPPSPTLNTGGTQQFTAIANDQNGNPLSPQPAFTWSVVSGGVGTISSGGLYSAGATAGTATVKATSGSVSGSASVTVTVPAPIRPTPYGGSAATVAPSGTTKVEAENYDLGGEGVAYHDTDNGGQTGYRSDNIGVYPDGGASNGYAVGWAAAGEWDGYTLNVAKAGVYKVGALVATPSGGGTFHLEFGPVGQVGGAGVIQSGEFTCPNTGGWGGSYQPVAVATVTLPAGALWMRLVVDSQYACNFDCFTLSPASTGPAAPTGLTATAGNASAFLSWTAPSGSGLTYNVKRATVSGGPYTTVGSSGGTSYPDSGLTNGTTYYYVVTAVGSAGESGSSNQASATPSTAALLAPMLSAQAQNTQVNLTWTPVTGATSYNLYRSTTPGGEGTTPYQKGLSGYSPYGGGATTSDSSLTNGTTYYYQVTAVGQLGEGPKSNEASATPGAAALAAPILKGTTSGTQNALTWSSVAGATSYNLYRYTGSGSSSYSAMLYQQGLTGTTFTDPGLTSSTTYNYYVDAVNVSGQGIQSNTVSLTPGSPALAAPLLSAQAGNAQVSLNWTAITGATSYNLYRSTSPGGEGMVPYQVGVAFPSFSYPDSNLTNGTTYYYKVVAVGPGGEGVFSNEASATPSANFSSTLLAAPVLKGVASSTQNTLTWSSVAGATNYNLYRIVGNGSNGYGPTLYRQGLTGTTFVDPGLTSGTQYTYSVAAVNTSGQGTQSNTVTLTLGAAALPATSLSASAGGSTQVNLNWKAVPGAASYDLYRGTAPGGEGAVPIMTGISSTSTSDTGLSSGTTYYYEVVAVGASGEGTLSNEASATPGVTGLPAPTISAAVDPTRNAVTLSWTAVPGATSYNLYRGAGRYVGDQPLYQQGLTGTSFTDFNLFQVGPGTSAAGSATYHVAGVNKDGEGTSSDWLPVQVNGFYLACPATVTIKRGATAAINLTLTPLGKFAGSVVLSGSATPTGAQGVFYPAAPLVNSQVGYATTGNLYFTVGATTSPGSYPITITGMANGFTYSTSITLVVQ